VDARSEIREFLTSRRAKITPEQAGLRTYGGNRRVPGLRREEVALLAGVSVDYYTRLQRGSAAGVSETVLEAFARALQLDEAERAHLFDLARAAHATPRRRCRPAPQWIRPSGRTSSTSRALLMRHPDGGAARRRSGYGRACSASSTR
jgi:transcriptional regulator with XRE-family HTH domain